jgi:hypothetical protein
LQGQPGAWCHGSPRCRAADRPGPVSSHCPAARHLNRRTQQVCAHSRLGCRSSAHGAEVEQAALPSTCSAALNMQRCPQHPGACPQHAALPSTCSAALNILVPAPPSPQPPAPPQPQAYVHSLELLQPMYTAYVHSLELLQPAALRLGPEGGSQESGWYLVIRTSLYRR